MESPASFDLANERMDMADDWERFRPGIEEGVALVEGRIGKGVELSGALSTPFESSIWTGYSSAKLRTRSLYPNRRITSGVRVLQKLQR